MNRVGDKCICLTMPETSFLIRELLAIREGDSQIVDTETKDLDLVSYCKVNVALCDSVLHKLDVEFVTTE